jgi:hypothetical protein
MQEGDSVPLVQESLVIRLMQLMISGFITTLFEESCALGYDTALVDGCLMVF